MPRPPKPTEMLKLSGGYRQDRHGHRVDAGGLDIPDELECPEHLDEPARAEWGRVLAVLQPLGVVTSLDRALLAVYCASWSRWVACEQGIDAGGLVVEGHRGVMSPNPLLRVGRDARDATLKAAAKLGLTPVDRAALNLPAKYEPDKLDALLAARDGIERFINPELLK